jgi:hypothetical protein
VGSRESKPQLHSVVESTKAGSVYLGSPTFFSETANIKRVHRRINLRQAEFAEVRCRPRPDRTSTTRSPRRGQLFPTILAGALLSLAGSRRVQPWPFFKGVTGRGGACVP